MTRRPAKQVALRKQPQQARSTELVSAVLDAALQVLAQEGAQRFTTARVAERAGVSVGSLYQYFPNKAAILFRLQTDEWRRTGELLRGILQDASRTPAERLRQLVHAFVQSECEEAAMRTALHDAAPLYRDAPEAQALRETSSRTTTTFMAEALPQADAATRTLAGDLLMTTLSTVGKHFSETPRTPADIAIYADGLADMLCAYLASLRQR
ncbi:TetR family transcriptional regulator [Pseudoduganella armeniaca]|uniref:TetR family transcriptional regulator n=1 Tax=Pseudoduganella armeniaca TaxID=2072590 RepID=A0A2R4C4U5_9BURK|nr:TetR family transcriptional regulator [Pseudoduganella armeniaca]AVR94578.1 TetR family transcriptional regulator [Pseudoduganella armeniaca]